jgi:hypothetical protein
MENKQDKPENQVRISANSSVGGVVRYVNALLKDAKYQEYDFSAIGIAIGKLVSVVELLKVVNPGLYQVNRISSVSEDIKDTSNKVISQRFYPKLDVRLTLNEPKEKGEGYQAKLDETIRNKLFTLLNQSTGNRPGGRGSSRGRGSFRGRGENRGRGSFRGRGENRGRGSFRGRGGLGAPRGRGGFGAPRGRGGFRGGPRGGPRGGQRGGPRGRGF